MLLLLLPLEDPQAHAAATATWDPQAQAAAAAVHPYCTTMALSGMILHAPCTLLPPSGGMVLHATATHQHDVARPLHATAA